MIRFRLALSLISCLGLLAAPGAAQRGPRVTQPRGSGPAEAAAPEAARICVASYEDLDGNGARGRGEPLVAEGRFAIHNAAGTIVARLAGSASAEACSGDLAPGAYEIRAAAQAGWRQTDPPAGGKSVALAAARTAQVAFGSQREGSR